MHKLPELARMLRQARLKTRMTREAVAQAARIEPPGLYIRMEEATMLPMRATLQRLCAVLRLDFDEVVKTLRDEEAEPLSP
jgi:transcriptional regulator with XRE-family HTH domain